MELRETFNDDDTKVLGYIMAESETLKSLLLDFNTLTDQGAKTIAEVLERRTCFMDESPPLTNNPRLALNLSSLSAMPLAALTPIAIMAGCCAAAGVILKYNHLFMYNEVSKRIFSRTTFILSTHEIKY